EEDAQHEVVQVHAPDDEIVERTLPSMDRVGDRPHDGEGQEEGDRGEEQALPAGIGKVLAGDGTRGAERRGTVGVRDLAPRGLRLSGTRRRRVVSYGRRHSGL